MLLANTLPFTTVIAAIAGIAQNMGMRFLKSRFAPHRLARDGSARWMQSRYLVDLAAQDRAIMQKAQADLARYGLAIDDGGCKTYAAAVGSSSRPFRFCPVVRLHKQV